MVNHQEKNDLTEMFWTECVGEQKSPLSPTQPLRSPPIRKKNSRFRLAKFRFVTKTSRIVKIHGNWKIRQKCVRLRTWHPDKRYRNHFRTCQNMFKTMYIWVHYRSAFSNNVQKRFNHYTCYKSRTWAGWNWRTSAPRRYPMDMNSYQKWPTYAI